MKNASGACRSVFSNGLIASEMSSVTVALDLEGNSDVCWQPPINGRSWVQVAVQHYTWKKPALPMIYQNER